MSRVTNVNESCHTHECVMSHIWILSMLLSGLADGFTWIYVYTYTYIHIYTLYTCIYGGGGWVLWERKINRAHTHGLGRFRLYYNWRFCSTLRHTAIHWNTPQRSAPHCNTSIHTFLADFIFLSSVRFSLFCAFISACHVTHKWAVSHMNESCHTWMSHVTHEWVMSHMDESCRTWICHVRRKYVTSPSTRFFLFYAFISVGLHECVCHTCMSHVTHEWVGSSVNTSCQTLTSHITERWVFFAMFRKNVITCEWVMPYT